MADCELPAEEATTTARADVRLRVPDRAQVKMRVGCDDELIPRDHQARVIWDVVGRMDLSAFYAPIQARDGVRGRDSTDPALLISLWLYAATRGVGSARELARLCSEDQDGSRPYLWLCGGVTLNYHTLSDFRVAHGEALDGLFTQVIAALVDRDLVKVHRVTQDGTRVRACAGAASYRGEERLNKLLAEARAHVEELKKQLEDPAASAQVTARQRAARERAARERQQRLEEAVAKMPAAKAKHKKAAEQAGDGECGKKLKKSQPRVSTTDAEARVMKMGDGGFRPAVNVQLAVDADSRAIVGVDVSDAGSDKGLSEPMREQVEGRAGRKVDEHLVDGGYLVLDEIDTAAEQGVTLFVPPPVPRDPAKLDTRYLPKPTDSAAQAEWRRRMGTDEAKATYRQRASTVETVNADLKRHRGLVQLAVRGLAKAKCVALWCALAYNLLHFGVALSR
jgi:transposase